MEAWRAGREGGWGVGPRPFAVAAHFLGVLSVVGVFIWILHFRGGLDYNAATSTQLIFNVHPTLMVLSLVFLASEGILVYKTIHGTKAFKKTIHLILHSMGFALAIPGTCAVFKQHNLKGILNLYSLHSWLGLVSLILFGCQWLIGFISFFYPGLAQSAKSDLVPRHVFFGLFTYGLCLASTELGYLEKITILQQKGTIGKFSLEAMFVNVLGIVVLLLAICVYGAIIVPMEDYARLDNYDPYD